MFKPKQVVWYTPWRGCPVDQWEKGIVSSVRTVRTLNLDEGEAFVAQVVFVKFDRQLEKFGWDGTTSQACDPKDLTDEAP
jgi:hypothetical protein